jgi:type I restriction enzyme M protein
VSITIGRRGKRDKHRSGCRGRTLWAAADELRADSKLTAVQYRQPVLGLIFLAYPEFRFEQVRPDEEEFLAGPRQVIDDPN